MLKTILLTAATTAAASAAVFTYVGTTTYSTTFQADVPFNSAFKVTPDPGNVWSWHHDFNHSGWGVTSTADVLVDMDGDTVMDTVHSVVRVMITDLQVVGPQGTAGGTVRIVDASGKRMAAGVGGSQGSSPVQHVGLTTPIVLPVGSFLHVELTGDQGAWEVNLIGRIVNP